MAILCLHSFFLCLPLLDIWYSSTLVSSPPPQMQNSSRPGVPTSSTGMISPGNNHRPVTPPRTLVLCFDGTGNQFDAVVRHGTDLTISCTARLPPLVEHEYCPILHYPGEGQQGPADGLLPGTSDTCWYHRYCTASRTSF